MRPVRLVALALTACLTACLGGGPKPSFYALSSGTDAAGAPVAKMPELGLAVGPIEFPRYLDRPELVTRDGENRLAIANAHRWGGSLRNDLLRVVADDLGTLLGTSRVVMYPSEPRFEARYRVLLDIRQFERAPTGEVVLRVRWTLAGVPDGKALAIGENHVEEATASSEIRDAVAAQSAALARVTRQIAEQIVALASAPE